MALDYLPTLNEFAHLFAGGRALSLDDQLRNVLANCERHDIMAFARMVCLKHADHQDFLEMSPEQARLFLEDIDLFLTAMMSSKLLKQ